MRLNEWLLALLCIPDCADAIDGSVMVCMQLPLNLDAPLLGDLLANFTLFPTALFTFSVAISVHK